MKACRPTGFRLRKLHAVRSLPALLLVCAAMAWTVQTASADSRILPRPKQPARASGVVRFEGTGFSAMNVQIVLGSSLSFSNPGSGALEVRIVTWRGRPVTNLLVRPHSRAAWKPARYGVYDYFDAGTTEFGSVAIHGAHGESVDQVVARKGSPAFPAPAYGVAVVTNAAGGGIPPSGSDGPAEVPAPGDLSVNHHRPFMKDPPWIEITRGTMTFKPWVLVVQVGEPIHLYDEDSMKHSFFPGVYPVMAVNHGYAAWYRRGFKGFDLHGNGGHRTIVFYRAGVYHAFCALHSHPWKHTYKPYSIYGGYPYVMDAVLVVEPRAKPLGSRVVAARAQ